MKITTRRVSMYLEVIIRHGDAVLELGLLDKDERRQLADELRETANDIEPAGDEDDPDYCEHGIERTEFCGNCTGAE